MFWEWQKKNIIFVIILLEFVLLWIWIINWATYFRQHTHLMNSFILWWNFRRILHSFRESSFLWNRQTTLRKLVTTQKSSILKVSFLFVAKSFDSRGVYITLSFPTRWPQLLNKTKNVKANNGKNKLLTY